MNFGPRGYWPNTLANMGRRCLSRVAQGTVCKILACEDVKPHKVRYYLEQRDEAFEQKMAEVLCVYQEVAVLRANDEAAGKTDRKVAIISYDEKPGIHTISNTAPDLPHRSRACIPASHATTNTSATAR